MQVVLVHLRRGRLLGHPGHQALAHLGVLYHPLFRSSLWAECNAFVLEIIILRHLLCVEPREPLLDVSLKFALLGVSSSLATASSWLLNFPSWLVQVGGGGQVVGGGQVQLVVQEHISQVGCCRSASTCRPCTGDCCFADENDRDVQAHLRWLGVLINMDIRLSSAFLTRVSVYVSLAKPRSLPDQQHSSD